MKNNKNELLNKAALINMREFIEPLIERDI